MKYVQINSVPHGSTGTIMAQIHREMLDSGHDSYICWGRGRKSITEREFKFGTQFGFFLDAFITLIDGKAGFHSKRATKRLIRFLDEIEPDVVHLHNIHGYYLNIEMLFGWLSKNDCKLIWTLHDCWAFTGHCAYFTYAKCYLWKKCRGCDASCSQLNTYPITLKRNSVGWNYSAKRRLFTGIDADRVDLKVPSHWLQSLVSQSFLSKYRVQVIPNKVNRAVFYPRESRFREEYALGGRRIVLGVASPWTERKGLSDFIWLSQHLDEEYVVVLVGLSRRQIRSLPSNMIGLRRTESAEILAGIYSSADVLVHPGIEETFGMNVAEACACGIPVVVREGSACIEAAIGGRCYVADNNNSSLLQCVIDAVASNS